MNAELIAYEACTETHSQIVSLFLEKKNFYFSICLFAFNEFSFDAETIATHTALGTAVDVTAAIAFERTRKKLTK